MDEADFRTEYAAASKLSSRSPSTFTSVLNKHVLLMIDASLEEPTYAGAARIGMRLVKVITSLFCSTS